MTEVLTLLSGVLVVLLITVVTGYFVAQEFAYMAVDRSALSARAAGGDPGAQRALAVTRRTSFMLSGAQLGIKPLPEALHIAREADLDLVEVAAQAAPPVARLMDFGRYKYEQSKKEREAKKHQVNVQLREVRMKPKIDEHDIDFKTRTARKLLKQGDKVKVTVMFRGREITHPQIGKNLLDRTFIVDRTRGLLPSGPRLLQTGIKVSF